MVLRTDEMRGEPAADRNGRDERARVIEEVREALPIPSAQQVERRQIVLRQDIGAVARIEELVRAVAGGDEGGDERAGRGAGDSDEFEPIPFGGFQRAEMRDALRTAALEDRKNRSRDVRQGDSLTRSIAQP